MTYDGLRFRAKGSLAGKIYGQPFGVDAAFGDPIIGEPELIRAHDTLCFAGIEPPMLRVYPVETHIAEKMHAYTMPRTRPNSRAQNLPNLTLIAIAGPHEASRLRDAIEQTFEQTFTFHSTHRASASAGAAGKPGCTVRDDGKRGSAAVDDDRRRAHSSASVPRPRSGGSVRWNLESRWMVLVRSGTED